MAKIRIVSRKTGEVRFVEPIVAKAKKTLDRGFYVSDPTQPNSVPDKPQLKSISEIKEALSKMTAISQVENYLPSENRGVVLAMRDSRIFELQEIEDANALIVAETDNQELARHIESFKNESAKNVIKKHLIELKK